MASKEDILEQIVEEYLLHQGYFVRHNDRFKPSRNDPDFDHKQDSVGSDIDVIAVNPNKLGHERVIVVSCKSWQGGFKAEYLLKAFAEEKVISGREAWRGFRELLVAKWSAAFREKIYALSGSQQFTYVIAVTKLVGEARSWELNADFSKQMGGNPIKILELKNMVASLFEDIGRTPAGTELGRTLQLMKAAGLSLKPSDWRSS